ncbi:hypothetical protein C8R42DRAFT_718564 [Lentinula raphanica]|nr:hypothetical protein C8R42DRAFT_718564 [Lentinula raphanica]
MPNVRFQEPIVGHPVEPKGTPLPPPSTQTSALIASYPPPVPARPNYAPAHSSMSGFLFGSSRAKANNNNGPSSDANTSVSAEASASASTNAMAAPTDAIADNIAANTKNANNLSACMNSSNVGLGNVSANIFTNNTRVNPSAGATPRTGIDDTTISGNDSGNNASANDALVNPSAGATQGAGADAPNTGNTSGNNTFINPSPGNANDTLINPSAGNANDTLVNPSTGATQSASVDDTTNAVDTSGNNNLANSSAGVNDSAHASNTSTNDTRINASVGATSAASIDDTTAGPTASPPAPTVLTSASKKKRSEMGPAEKAAYRKASAARAEKLNADLEEFHQAQDSMISKITEDNEISVQRVKRLVYHTTQSSKKKKASDHNVLVFIKSQEVNAGRAKGSREPLKRLHELVKADDELQQMHQEKCTEPSATKSCSQAP